MQKMQGRKIKMTVVSNVMVLGIFDHYPWSKAHVHVFCENIEFHQTALQKRESAS